MNEYDLTGTELWREYVYTDGYVYRVDKPGKLYIKSKPEGDSHRVVDGKGATHYITSGWRVLRWEGKTVF